MALPELWVERIFLRLSAIYGTRFADLWGSSNLQEVKRVWAHHLAGFEDQPYRIAHALEDCARRPYPPTLPEFLELCRLAPAQAEQAEALPGPELDPETVRANIRRIEADIASAVDGDRRRDPFAWAKRPRSAHAVRLLARAAKQDSRLERILAGHVANRGANCTSDLARREMEQLCERVREQRSSSAGATVV